MKTNQHIPTKPHRNTVINKGAVHQQLQPTHSTPPKSTTTAAAALRLLRRLRHTSASRQIVGQALVHSAHALLLDQFLAEMLDGVHELVGLS